MGFSPQSLSLSAAKGFCLFSISSKDTSASLSRAQAFNYWSSEFLKEVLLCVCKLKAGFGHHLLCYPAGYFLLCHNTSYRCNYGRIKQVSDSQPLLRKQ